ncbi:MAG TPA: transcriptional regulator GcvA [Gammaproteobacteria bacterium]|jgi:LysR family glycine cleavage system transcriptional activator
MARDLPSLNAVRMFEVAARELNFTRAAERLHVTQGAVSRQIKQLEAELGQALFRREGRRLVLTDAGEQYRGVVDEALAVIRQGTSRLRDHGRDSKLTLSVLPSFASRWLIPRLQSYQSLHPDLDLWLGTSYDPVDFTRPTEIDAAIRFGRGGWSGTHVEPLVQERVAPVCTPDIGAKLTKPSDVLKFKLLGDKPPWDEWQPWLHSQGIRRAHDAPALSSDFSIILQAAVEGHGVALARDLLVADDLRAGRLVRPFPRGVYSAFNYYFVCSPLRAGEPHIRSFLEWLREAMQKTVANCWP